MIQLSKRLKTVASFVTVGKCVADIGTDHGYVPIYLVQNGIAPRVLAMDVNKGPILHANDNIEKYGLSNVITTRLSNGLREYNIGEAEAIVIAGMGGGLIVDILTESIEKWQNKAELILSPHSDTELVRRFLCDNHMTIVKETMLIDEGKYYTVMKAVYGESCYDTVEEYRYGKLLLEEKNPVLYDFLKKELSKKENIASLVKDANNEAAFRRVKEIEDDIAVVHKALQYFA
ncbi:MAG: SAM-dependent methyltransferase [Lachnospiraceae bacterium]|nr:SAM-dependent methyltransferase [Lachnospiraceae bacterium]